MSSSQLETEMRLFLENRELAEQEEAARVEGHIPWYFTQGRKAKQIAKVKLRAAVAKPSLISHFPNTQTS